MKTSVPVLGLVLVVLCAAGTPATACSICRCGDNGCRLSERDLLSSGLEEGGRFGISIGNMYSSKSNALDPEEGNGSERQREFRPSLRGTYELNAHLGFSAELPLSFRRLKIVEEEGTAAERASGLGDADLTLTGLSNLFFRSGCAYTGAVSAALKLPTGQNDLKSEGERREEHLQAGTGSYDYTLGGGLARSSPHSRIFISAYFRHNGTNRHAYHYGHAALFNLGGQRALAPWLVASLQLNSRYAKRDLDGTEPVGDTGGWVSYVTPGVRLALGANIGFSASIQLPIWQNLYGSQSEKAVLITGLTLSP